LTEFLTAGQAELFYQFDPNYVDECHPNYPDCHDGQNACPHCSDPDNPLLRVAGKVITYSNDENVLASVHPELPEEAFIAEIYPNPAKSQFTLSTNYEKGVVCVLVLNMQGQIMANFTMEGQHTIDVSRWPAGVYTVQMLGGSVVTRKLVVE
jgi:hypothetical protein